MENININVSVKDLTEMVKQTVGDAVKLTLARNQTTIEKSINDYFIKSMWDNKQSTFENALDWAVENAFREGLNKAMDEMNFKEIIANKAKDLLSDNNFISELAEAKVRASLGLPATK